ncbi:hypothetical protein ACVWXS_005404 [Lysinibacillus sp. TE18511]
MPIKASFNLGKRVVLYILKRAKMYIMVLTFIEKLLGLGNWMKFLL